MISSPGPKDRPPNSRRYASANPKLVTGAVIVDQNCTPRRVLAGRREHPKELSGLWEFPGGKVEPEETPEAGLAREIREELGIGIHVCSEILHPSGTWPVSSKYEMRLYFATVTDGCPLAGDSHSELRWISVDELDNFAWLPADSGAIKSIRDRLSDGDLSI